MSQAQILSVDVTNCEFFIAQTALFNHYAFIVEFEDYLICRDLGNIHQ